MKKILIPIGTLLVTSLAHAQLSPTENYVYSKTYLSDPTLPNPKTSETVQYFDGLGRPKQVVNVKASPLGRDVVNHIEYDGFGRQAKDFLPIPQSSTQNGAIFPTPLGNASAIYGGEKIYAEKILENSPLDRIQQQIQVGTDWSTKPVRFYYDANVENEVFKFVTSTIWENNATKSTLSLSVYAPNQLYKNTVIDEDGNKTLEFKNGQGQILLVRKMLNDTEHADTYYVYNEYNQLAFVIPPTAVYQTMTEDVLNNLCYQYRYDGRNRLVEKKVPGKGWEYMLYDIQDRLVATQDTVLKDKGQWLYTKYDQFGRVAITGIGTGYQRSVEQNTVDGFGSNNVNRVTAAPFNRQGVDVYYGSQDSSYPNSPNWVTLLSLTYYDTYPAYSFNPTFPSSIINQPTLTDNPATDGKSTKGLPVMSLVKNIEDDNWTKSYSYYDQKGRVVGTYSINHLGGYTKTESELDFAGVPQKVYTYHARKSDEAGITVKERFVYDSQNRLLQHYHQVDSKPEELLVQNEYNELSQLKNKKVGNNLQSIDYAYNIRGWMTDINKDQMSLPDLGGKLFSYKIKYNQKDGITNPDNALFSGKDVKPKFNGNIAEVDWRAVETLGVNPSSTPKRYGYAYDNLNRLMAGYYQNPNNPYSKENTESLAYDLNGNITNLYRTSVLEGGTNTATAIDRLTYTYTGNQVTNINDVSQNPTGYEGGGSTIEYDLNGSMVTMPDKGISSIRYNYLNLPNNLVLSKNGNENLTINTKYRVDGTKLTKENTTTIIGFNGSTTTKKTTDYLDGFQYLKIENINGGGSSEMLMASSLSRRAMQPMAFSLVPALPDPKIDPPLGVIVDVKTPDLQFFPTAEGFYDYQKSQYIYQYKDHLGNNRVSYGRNSAGVLEITDANDYYPFGMNHLKSGNAFFGAGSYKAYKYNGKELQESGMYDFGARFYMADLGRWGVIDPLAEKYRRMSSYNYALDNPMRFIDPDGRQVMDPIYGKKNAFSNKLTLIGDDGKNAGKAYIVTGSVRRDVEAATKNGGKYNGNLSESRNVAHIPTGNRLQSVIGSVVDTKNSGRENGGFAFKGDKNVTRSDEGMAPRQFYNDSNQIVTEASMLPFKSNGKGGLPKNASNLEMWWHDHPDVIVKTISSKQLGESTPSSADFDVQGTLEERGYKGNSFVIGTHTNEVTYFNGSNTIVSANYDDWKNAGVNATVSFVSSIITNILLSK